jgi:hypothetical protein
MRKEARDELGRREEERSSRKVWEGCSLGGVRHRCYLQMLVQA